MGTPTVASVTLFRVYKLPALVVLSEDMRTLKVALVPGCSALGCGTAPSPGGGSPAEGFTGRKLRVEISGDATDWKDGATVDFGAGVTVASVTVASPTDLFADITIDPAATVGAR